MTTLTVITISAITSIFTNIAISIIQNSSFYKFIIDYCFTPLTPINTDQYQINKDE